MKFIKGKKKKDYFLKFKKTRRHSWMGHTVKHNESITSLKEQYPDKKGHGKTSTKILKEIRQEHRS
jgi:hypothetical protein